MTLFISILLFIHLILLVYMILLIYSSIRKKKLEFILQIWINIFMKIEIDEKRTIIEIVKVRYDE